MISVYRLVEMLYNATLYAQNLVFFIDDKGLVHRANSFGEILSAENPTVKIEGMERFSSEIFKKGISLSEKYDHFGPVTCHLFYAKEKSPSFGVHSDPDDVIILCLEGRKRMIVEDKEYILLPGDELYIPRGTLHQALNEDESLTLSFGLERFIEDKMNELDVLSQNHRNM